MTQRRGGGRASSKCCALLDLYSLLTLLSRFIPTFFEKGLDNGYSELTAEGWKAVEDELAEPSPFCVEGGIGKTNQAQTDTAFVAI
jgi:hypothetical protein